MNNGLSIRSANKLFTSCQLKPSELASYCFNIAKFSQPQYNAFSDLFPLGEILSAAKASDERYRNSKPLSDIDGIPISIKSNISIKNKPFTAGSNILKNLKGYDSFVVNQLRKSGAILIGLCSMDEFGMGSLGDNCNNDFARNPLPHIQRSYRREGYQSDDQKLQKIKALSLPDYCVDDISKDDCYFSGGSSSGSAVSVALGSSLASIGTDTGGSVRLPAAWCGVVGLKPTYGLLSRKGLISYASSLDTVGIISNTPNCAEVVLNSLRNDEILGEDIKAIGDSTVGFDTCYNNDGDPKLRCTEAVLQGMRVGIPEAFVVQECSPKILKAWERAIEMLQANGASIETITDEVISSTDIRMSLPAYYVLSSAEASSNLARFDGFKFGSDTQIIHSDETSESLEMLNSREKMIASNRSQGFGVEVKRRILAGTAVLSSDRFHSYYESAATIRAQITSQFNNAFKTNGIGVDLIVIPSALSDPPHHHKYSSNRTKVFENDVMTTPISLAGLPSVSVPVSYADNVWHSNQSDPFPMVGIQLIGPKYSEETVLQAASAISCEKETITTRME